MNNRSRQGIREAIRNELFYDLHPPLIHETINQLIFNQPERDYLETANLYNRSRNGLSFFANSLAHAPALRPEILEVDRNLLNAQTRDFDILITESLQAAAGPSEPIARIGANAQKLAAVNYEGDIEPEYCCAITYDIMTTPVFDPQTLISEHVKPVYFELEAITRELSRTPFNPFTRQPLRVEDLQYKRDLEARIAIFVESIVEEANKNNQPAEASTSPTRRL